MTEITINLTGREAREILDGLLEMSYQAGKRAEAEELKVIEYQMDDNDVGEAMAKARATRAREKEKAACSAYDKIKKEAMRLGLIS